MAQGEQEEVAPVRNLLEFIWKHKPCAEFHYNARWIPVYVIDGRLIVYDWSNPARPVDQPIRGLQPIKGVYVRGRYDRPRTRAKNGARREGNLL